MSKKKSDKNARSNNVVDIVATALKSTGACVRLAALLIVAAIVIACLMYVARTQGWTPQDFANLLPGRGSTAVEPQSPPSR